MKDGATADASDSVNPYDSLILSDSRATIHKAGKRNHHKKPMSKLLPPCESIDMTMCGKPWFPLCRITDASNNVSVEATVENFKALFEIVNEQLVCEATGTRTPARSVRRRKSDPQAPKCSPGSKIYYVAGK